MYCFIHLDRFLIRRNTFKTIDSNNTRTVRSIGSNVNCVRLWDLIIRKYCHGVEIK
ncbi:MAG: hypothetical protein Pg6B_09050 [Candidatus Azobacteroides pseudotrichonymphae]|jgi:hypothetical protein|nr:MAG: hypothetical protein Pg6B_09050 [Candidatus Azobacteroides pseudotrichonymphae]